MYEAGILHAAFTPRIVALLLGDFANLRHHLILQHINLNPNCENLNNYSKYLVLDPLPGPHHHFYRPRSLPILATGLLGELTDLPPLLLVECDGLAHLFI